MRIFFAIFLCLLSASAFAEDWARIIRFPAGTIYVNTSSIKKQGRLTTAQILVDFRKHQTDRASKKLIRSALSTESYNCTGKRFGSTDFTSLTGQMGRGSVIATRSNPLELKDVPPDSLAEARLKYVCSFK